MKAEHGDNLAWLDAGDNFFGTWDSKVMQGGIISTVFNDFGLKYSTFGNHEFDQDFPMNKFLSNTQTAKYIVSNVWKNEDDSIQKLK